MFKYECCSKYDYLDNSVAVEEYSHKFYKKRDVSLVIDDTHIHE